MSNVTDRLIEEEVRRANIRDLKREEMSDLGRELYDLSREYELSGGDLLSEQEIQVELTRRRGGYVQNHAT